MKSKFPTPPRQSGSVAFDVEIVRMVEVGADAASFHEKIRNVVELSRWPQYIVSMLFAPSPGTHTRWPKTAKDWLKVVKETVRQSAIWSMLSRIICAKPPALPTLFVLR